MSTPLTLRGLHSTEGIVWECGGVSASGVVRYYFLTAENRDKLLAAFGREWLDKHLADTEREIKSFDVN